MTWSIAAPVSVSACEVVRGVSQNSSTGDAGGPTINYFLSRPRRGQRGLGRQICAVWSVVVLLLLPA